MAGKRVGFKAARDRLVRALEEGRFWHEPRDVSQGKNLLDTNAVTPEIVAALVRSCNGTQYEESPHQLTPEVAVHIFKPIVGNVRWYIKVYFLGDDVRESAEPVVFISMHTSEVEWL